MSDIVERLRGAPPTNSMTARHMIDPPSGWKYGFPKELPEGTEDIIAWLLENGYPQHEIDACGDNFYCRHYNEDDEVDRLKAIASKAIREQIPMGEEIERLKSENEKLRKIANKFMEGLMREADILAARAEFGDKK